MTISIFCRRNYYAIIDRIVKLIVRTTWWVARPWSEENRLVERKDWPFPSSKLPRAARVSALLSRSLDGRW